MIPTAGKKKTKHYNSSVKISMNSLVIIKKNMDVCSRYYL